LLINKLYISLSSWMSNRAWRKGNTRLTVANEMHKQNIARHKNQKNSHAKTRKVTYTHIEKNCMQICKYKLETKSVASSSQSPPHTDRNDWFEFATKWKPNCVHISTGCSEERCNVVAIFHTSASSNSSVSRTTARWRCKKSLPRDKSTNLSPYNVSKKDMTILDILVELRGRYKKNR